MPTRHVAVLITMLTSLLALTALAFSVTLFLTRTSQIQTSRRDSATDTCLLFQRIIRISSAQQHKTAEGQRFLVTSGLSNCHTYGQRVTKLP